MFHKLGSFFASIYHRGEKNLPDWIFVPKLLNSLSQNQSQRIDLVIQNDPIWRMLSKWVETTNQMKMYFILHCGESRWCNATPKRWYKEENFPLQSVNAWVYQKGPTFYWGKGKTPTKLWNARALRSISTSPACENGNAPCTLGRWWGTWCDGIEGVMFIPRWAGGISKKVGFHVESLLQGNPKDVQFIQGIGG